MINDELNSYKKFVKQKLNSLTSVFASASIGDFSKDVKIPEKEDEFTEFFVGIQIVLEVVREKEAENKKLIAELEKIVRERTEELKKSEERLRQVFEYSTSLLYSHTPDHRLTYLSPRTKDFFGLSPKEAMKKWTEFATENPVNKIGLELTNKAIKTGKRQPPYELELWGKGGRKIWVLVNETPVVKGGKTIAIVGSLTEITERKMTEDRLNAKTRELEQMNRFMVGRELKMIELKNEIDKLKKYHGKTSK